METLRAPLPGDVCVVCRELPDAVHGFLFRRGEGYCVVLNAASTPERRQRALAHELGHIARGDDRSPLPVREIERRARLREKMFARGGEM